MTPDNTQINQWIKDIRRDFHQRPELSGQEIRTTRKICEVLESLNAKITTFDDYPGAIGVFQGEGLEPGENPKTIAIRADIDALPLHEMGESAYKSVNAGVMHACGHDANTAIALGVAKRIVASGLLKKIHGSVKFIFQPAEERLGGARAMIKRGALENPRVDQLIAGHMDPNFPVGSVGVFTEIGHAASDPFELVITGKGSHGARPHKGHNPITAGGMFASGLEALIPRNISPAQSAVVSIGSFHAGNAGNVIPEKAILQGSVRTHDEEVRTTLFAAMEQLVRGIETIFSVTCDLTFKPGAPLGRNDKTVCKSLYTASETVLGKENITVLPFIMGSDDFYFFAQRCPAAMMRFGCAGKTDDSAHPLHSPYFDIHEDVLKIGTDILFQAVKNFFTA
jgi:amidohydrolase